MDALIALLAAVSLGLRLYQIQLPSHVCWDEVHFGKHASYYINRTVFFDVHPPLGKLILAVTGHWTGYNGEFTFDKPGDSLEHINYVGMRQVSALFGSAVVPLSAAIVWELSNSVTAAFLTGILVISDTGLTVMSRYILLDPFLLFFILLSCYFYIKHTKLREFERLWWLYLCGCGTSLACAVGVKFVGLFVVAHIGLSTAHHLWHIVGQKEIPIEKAVQQVLARIYTLICLPVLVYCFIYVIHFITLNKSGKGDGFYSSAFQTTIMGNPLYHARMPEYVAFGSEITIKNYRTNGGYLHSHVHLYPKEVGPPHQQVTSYSHKDTNNHWIIKRATENARDPSNAVYIKDGDLVRLEHKQTKRNLHSHDKSAPLTRNHRQVSCYGTAGVGDDNDTFKIRIVYGHQDEDRISPIFSIFQLIHVNEQCVVECKGKQLPKWASEQKEVTCNPDTSALSSSLWNVEELTDPRLSVVRLDWKHDRPGFISKLVETHLVMLSNNRDLKPKPDEFISRPWMWPLAYKGQLFSSEPHILMLGNPVTHWLVLLLLAPTLVLFGVDMLRQQRNKAYDKTDGSLAQAMTTYGQLGWLSLAYLLHYLPFWPMTRILYPHHYLPAYVFSCMFTGLAVDHILHRLASVISPTPGSAVRWCVVLAISSLSLISFYLLSPLVYGYDSTADDNPMTAYQLSKYWDF